MGELVERVQERIAHRPALVVKLHAEVADTLGRALLQGLGERFDEHVATASIRLFDLAEIPAIRDALPREVSRVRFVSDVNSMEPIDVATAQQRFPALGFLRLE